jgi:hypothetical protein
VPDADVEALRASAPSYLTTDTARDHLAAARLAALLEHEDASTLLAVAWHESRYTSNVATREPGARWSCGVMTPVPHAEPCVDRSLLEQYLEGAAHLHEWRALLGDRALEGYCGGVGSDRAIAFRVQMQRRAAWIRGAKS